MDPHKKPIGAFFSFYLYRSWHFPDDYLMRRNSVNTPIISAVVVCAVAVILFFSLGRKFARFTGNMPFVIDQKFYQSIQTYSSTRPSRYIYAVTGGHRSGKSRILNLAAKQDSAKGLCTIIVDFAISTNLNDAIELLKLKIFGALLNSADNLDSSELKRLSEIHVYDNQKHNTTATFPNQQLLIPYNAICDALDSITRHGFNEYGVYEFFDALSVYEQIFHFALYVHNFDALLGFSTLEEPNLGEKVSNAIVGRLANGNQYTLNIPIYVEISNSLRRIKNKEIVHYEITPSIEEEVQELVKMKVFQARELKVILQQIGAHPGSLSDIFEDLKFDIPLDVSIAKSIEKSTRFVKEVTDGKTNKAIAEFCKTPDNFIAKDENSLETMKDLFANGLLVLKRGLKVQAANKVVLNTLCNLK